MAEDLAAVKVMEDRILPFLIQICSWIDNNL